MRWSWSLLKIPERCRMCENYFRKQLSNQKVMYYLDGSCLIVQVRFFLAFIGGIISLEHTFFVPTLIFPFLMGSAQRGGDFFFFAGKILLPTYLPKPPSTDFFFQGKKNQQSLFSAFTYVSEYPSPAPFAITLSTIRE